MIAALALAMLMTPPTAAAMQVPGVAAAAQTPAARVRALLRRIVPDGDGVVVGVLRDRRMLFTVARGMRDRARGLPVDAQTVFHAGAVTAQFTDFLAALAATQGRIHLNAAVGDYLPSFTGHPDLRVRNLLHQSSGLADYTQFPDFAPAYGVFIRTGSMDAVVAQLVAAAPRFAPGTAFGYSASNARLLQLVLERVDGMSLQRIFARRIARPLGLRSSRIGSVARTQDRAIGYRADGRAAAPFNLAWAGGAAGLTTTVPDLLRWDGALLGGGLPPRAVHLALSPSPIAPTGMGHYAAGWVIDALDGHPMDWHDGRLPGFRAMNAIFPRDGVAVAVLANAASVPVETIAFRTFGIVAGLPAARVRIPDAARRAAHAASTLATAVLLGAILIGALALLIVRRSIGWGVAATAAGGLGGAVAALLASAPQWWVFAVALLPVCAYAAFTAGARNAAR